jgi:hypothetical protein
MLSMIRRFEIDPNLAITGDVSADAKVHCDGEGKFCLFSWPAR